MHGQPNEVKRAIDKQKPPGLAPLQRWSAGKPSSNPEAFQDSTTTKADDWALVIGAFKSFLGGIGPFVLLGICLFRPDNPVSEKIAIGVIGFLSREGVEYIRDKNDNG